MDKIGKRGGKGKVNNTRIRPFVLKLNLTLQHVADYKAA